MPSPALPLTAAVAFSLAACSGAPEAPSPASPGSEAPGVAPPPARPQPRGGPPAPPKPFHAAPTFDLVGEPAETPRSIVLISLDTVRADRLSVYGGRAETPTLEAVAAAGARFTQARTPFPETCLAHQAMHTGVPPEAHGNAPAHRGSVYTGPTLAEIAQRHGFATGAFIGGVTLTRSACGLDRGFATYDDQFPLDRADMKRPGAQVTQRAARWISAQTGPTFAFVHYFDAHFPYTPAPPWDSRYDPGYRGSLTGSDADLRPFRDGGQDPTADDLAHVLALYDGELSELDALLQPVLDAAGPDALVLVTADHGESFGHGYWFNHRDALWEGVLRVPMLLRGPGVPEGASVEQPVSLLDVAPTLLDLAGLPLDARMTGRSLAPALQGEELPQRAHHATTDPWRTPTQRAVVERGVKLLARPSGVARYALSADPAELAPLPATEAEFEQVWQPHAAALDALSAHQVEPPAAPPPLSDDEAARLEALGYRDPAKAPPPRQPPR